VPLFEPGYGSQYLFWSIPLLASTYYLSNEPRLRFWFGVSYAVGTITYLIEYSFFISHGALAAQIRPKLSEFAFSISTRRAQTIRFPLFLGMMMVFLLTIHDLFKPPTSNNAREASP
jgi:hypothetical protein